MGMDERLVLEMISQQQWEQLPQAYRDVCDSINLKREDFTCNGCAGLIWDKPCEYAWDIYNTHGDCLLEK
jgi:hypothetical protein